MNSKTEETTCIFRISDVFKTVLAKWSVVIAENVLFSAGDLWQYPCKFVGERFSRYQKFTFIEMHKVGKKVDSHSIQF